MFAVEKETGNAKPIMVDDELAVDGDVNGNEPRRPNRNSQLYQASNADKLMETELTKLRGECRVSAANADRGPDAHLLFNTESEEVEDDAVADADEEDVEEGTSLHDPSGTATFYPTYAQPAHANLQGTLSAQPRSPGLPSSPRPGAIFETAPGQITASR